MKYPELYDDVDIEELVEKVYSECREKDCDSCPRRNEIESGVCKTDLINDLWRHWKNLKREDA